MRLEETQQNWRCWLSNKEEKQLINYYDSEDDTTKKIAIQLMLKSGLRANETTRVQADHIEPSDDKTDFKRLKIYETKTTYRETIIPDHLATQIKTISSFTEGSILDVTTRTVRNWVIRAGEELVQETENEDWYKITAHDLRRTWATNLIQQGIPSDLVMSWGGWEDHDTFTEHYWEPSDEAIQEHLDRIDFNY